MMGALIEWLIGKPMVLSGLISLVWYLMIVGLSYGVFYGHASNVIVDYLQGSLLGAVVPYSWAILLWAAIMCIFVYLFCCTHHDTHDTHDTHHP